MEINEIERKIACQEMTAPQVFTQMRQHISVPVYAPIDNGIPALDNLCGKFNRGEINLSQLVCSIWNVASYSCPPPPPKDK